jgi:GNAT superfamily N-acetyltransferase
VTIDSGVEHFALAQATPGDLDQLVELLDDVSAWLRGRGVAQWPAHFSIDWLMPAVAGGETWLAHVDRRLTGTVTLSWSDPMWPDDGAAGYVHRLAVRRDAAGLGRRLLDWAAATAIGAGRDRLRLDCVAWNQRLRGYYEAAGFVYRGDSEVRGAPGQRAATGSVTVVSRFERLLATPGGS